MMSYECSDGKAHELIISKRRVICIHNDIWHRFYILGLFKGNNQLLIALGFFSLLGDHMSMLQMLNGNKSRDFQRSLRELGAQLLLHVNGIWPLSSLRPFWNFHPTCAFWKKKILFSHLALGTYVVEDAQYLPSVLLVNLAGFVSGSCWWMNDCFADCVSDILWTLDKFIYGFTPLLMKTGANYFIAKSQAAILVWLL